MEDEDAMVLVIVGDEDQPFAMPIKEEPLDVQDSDLNVESIIQTAETHGQFIAIDIKAECDYTDCEYLEMDFEDKMDTRNCKLWKKHMPIPITETKIKQDLDFKSNTRRVAVKPPAKYKCSTTQTPYIAQLRKNFPKMRNNEDFLISSLAETMRSTKPPPPPPDFYHDVDGKYVCVYCEAVSVSLPAASRHYQSRHGVRYLICFACGHDYRCTTMLYKHEKRCSAPGAELVLRARGRYLGRKGRSRPYCTGEKFIPSLVHTNPPSVKKRKYCSQCPASFLHSEALQGHENAHLGIRPFHCDQCPATYTSNLALQKHLRSHTDERVTCDACGRTFKLKATLVMHMNTHLPQRKYPCPRCPRRFAQRCTLRTHVNRDHLNLPLPYACAVCTNRYPRMHNLKIHMKAKHGLTVMTRNSFLKALPNLSESVLKHAATLVINDDLSSPSKLNDEHTKQRIIDLSACLDYSDTNITSNEDIDDSNTNIDTSKATEETPDNAENTQIIEYGLQIELKDYPYDQEEMQDMYRNKENSCDEEETIEIPETTVKSIEAILANLGRVGVDIYGRDDVILITEGGEARLITENNLIDANSVSSMLVDNIAGAITFVDDPTYKSASKTNNRIDFTKALTRF